MKLPLIKKETIEVSPSGENSQVILELGIPDSIIYFEGHFPNYPILPGVAQIHWAEALGRLYFNNMGLFTRLEVIKFQSMLFPNNKVTLTLKYSSDKQKLSFTYANEEQKYSSGRIVLER